jgi:predicted nuclease of predicted toxin-antitoxin system
MKLLVDMNLSPKFADFLVCSDVIATHWSTVGAATATDSEIVNYALQNDYVIVTCDLDFSAILSVTHVKKPSIVQVRTRYMPLNDLADIVMKSISQNIDDLNSGAILTIDAKKSRSRLLPL